MAVAEAKQHELSAKSGELEQRHQAEVLRLKAAMVELEKHLESRARAEMTAKKRLQELERAAAAPKSAAPDAAEIASLKEALRKVSDDVEELRGENDFLNGEVARYVQKNGPDGANRLAERGLNGPRCRGYHSGALPRPQVRPGPGHAPPPRHCLPPRWSTRTLLRGGALCAGEAVVRSARRRRPTRRNPPISSPRHVCSTRWSPARARCPRRPAIRPPSRPFATTFIQSSPATKRRYEARSRRSWRS